MMKTTKIKILKLTPTLLGACSQLIRSLISHLYLKIKKLLVVLLNRGQKVSKCSNSLRNITRLMIRSLHLDKSRRLHSERTLNYHKRTLLEIQTIWNEKISQVMSCKRSPSKKSLLRLTTKKRLIIICSLRMILTNQ